MVFFCRKYKFSIKFCVVNSSEIIRDMAKSSLQIIKLLVKTSFTYDTVLRTVSKCGFILTKHMSYQTVPLTHINNLILGLVYL
jgi:hypothetical protein